MKNQSAPLAILALLGAMLLWSSSFVATKAAYAVLHPITLVAGRMIVGTVVLVVFFFNRLRPANYQAGDWKWLVFMGLAEPCLYFMFEAYALRYTTASQAGMITAILPLLVSVAAVRVLAEKVQGKRLMGLMVAMAGVIWLTLAGSPEPTAPNPVLGNVLEFAAMVCATGYMISVRRLSSRYNALTLTAAQTFTGTLFFVPMLFLPGIPLPAHIDFTAVASVVYLGVFVTLGACGLYNFGAGRIPASSASTYVNLIPVFTVALGWIFLNETLNAYQFLACAVVFVGVFLSRDGRLSEPSRPTQP